VQVVGHQVDQIVRGRPAPSQGGDRVGTSDVVRGSAWGDDVCGRGWIARRRVRSGVTCDRRR